MLFVWHGTQQATNVGCIRPLPAIRVPDCTSLLIKQSAFSFLFSIG